jgi:hypothetical protein
MRKILLLLGAVALVFGLTACDNHDTLYHCGIVYQQRVQPYPGHQNDQLVRGDRSGNWDFCDFRNPDDGHIHNFYINIHDHTIQGG